jgi:hypothetical protein
LTGETAPPASRAAATESGRRDQAKAQAQDAPSLGWTFKPRSAAAQVDRDAQSDAERPGDEDREPRSRRGSAPAAVSDTPSSDDQDARPRRRRRRRGGSGRDDSAEGGRSRNSRDVVSSLDVLTDPGIDEPAARDTDDAPATSSQRPRRSRGPARNDSPARVAVFFDQDTFGGSQGPKLEAISRAVEEFGRAASIQVYGRSQRLPEPGNIDASILLEMKTTLTGSLDESRVRLIADALEVAFSKPGLDVIALVTRDDALMPLANKLSDLGKTVIALTDGKAPGLVSVCDDSVELEAPRGRASARSGRGRDDDDASEKRGDGRRSSTRGGRSRTTSRPDRPARPERNKKANEESADSRDKPARRSRRSATSEADSRERPARRGRGSANSEADSRASRPERDSGRRRSRASTEERPTRDRRPARSEAGDSERPARRSRTRTSSSRDEDRQDKAPARASKTTESVDPTEAYAIIRETVDSLARRFGDAIWSDTLRDELRDSHDLTPGSLGLSTFEQLLREAEKNDALILQRDPRNRRLVIYSLEEED